MNKGQNEPTIISIPFNYVPRDLIRKTLTANGMCEMFDFRIPKLKITSLEDLLQLSEDLHKIEVNTKSLVEKMLKLYRELVSSESLDSLLVEGVRIQKYLEEFSWNESRFPHSKLMKDDRVFLQKELDRIEKEFLVLSVKYQDSKSKLAAIKRKKGSPIQTAPLESLLTREELMKRTNGMSFREVFIETNSLQTIAIVMNEQHEKAFLEEYEHFCEHKEDDAEGENICPSILPRSAKKVFVDREGNMMYSVVVLKKFIPEISALCKEKRLFVRIPERTQSVSPLTKVEGKETDVQDEETQIAILEAANKKIITDTLSWTRPTYSDCMVYYVHTKVIRLYIESVLRYGLRTEQYTFIIFPVLKHVKKLCEILEKTLGGLAGREEVYGVGNEFLNVSGLESSDMTEYPYACISVERIGV